MPYRSKGNGSYCARWLLLGHAARAMPLGRCWPGVRASAASEPWAIDLSNAPEMEHCVAADRQRCCTEKSFFKSMAKLLAMLLPIVAHDVACWNRRRLRATPCSLRDPLRAVFPAAAHCIGPAAPVVAPQKMIRLLCTKEDCGFCDRSSWGAERCPIGRFASVVPAAAAPSAASIVPRSIARHRTFAVMLCYVSFFSND